MSTSARSHVTRFSPRPVAPSPSFAPGMTASGIANMHPGVTLAALVAHHACLLLLTRYSLAVKQERYSLPAMVLAVEICKLLACAAALWVCGCPIVARRLCSGTWTRHAALPGALGALGELFLLLALRHISAVQVALFLPLTLLAATAITAVFVPSGDAAPSAASGASSASAPSSKLHQRLALLLLLAGLAIVAFDPPLELSQYDARSAADTLSSGGGPSARASLSSRAHTLLDRGMVVGLVSLLATGVVDGFARVYLGRKVLLAELGLASSAAVAAKGPHGWGPGGSSFAPPAQPSVWQRQLQLSVWGACLASLVLFASEVPAMLESVTLGHDSFPDSDQATHSGSDGSHRLSFLAQVSSTSIALVVLQGFGSVLLSYLLASVNRRGGQSGAALFTALLVLLLSLVLPSFALQCTPLCAIGIALAIGGLWRWHDDVERQLARTLTASVALAAVAHAAAASPRSVSSAEEEEGQDEDARGGARGRREDDDHEEDAMLQRQQQQQQQSQWQPYSAQSQQPVQHPFTIPAESPFSLSEHSDSGARSERARPSFVFGADR